ncbi:unnamed protein product [Fraxinus pennsylvanica]|uniref:Uncharacterized protein n=1 Tax=Fraxinus pennsylvanica TaxID=56036 RepID=A0AAD2A703_9LAMI|nr:unnamed protein product [Fraxinus pennsylvanica]
MHTSIIFQAARQTNPNPQLWTTGSPSPEVLIPYFLLLSPASHVFEGSLVRETGFLKRPWLTLSKIQNRFAVNDVDDDPDFSDSDHDVYDEDDMLFDCNVTERIEIGMHNILANKVAPEYDSSSNASSEELKIGSGSDSDENIGKLNFPEFLGATEKKKSRTGDRFYCLGLLRNRNLLLEIMRSSIGLNQFSSEMRRIDSIVFVHMKKYVTYKWLADYYLEDFRADPEWKTKHIRGRGRKDLGVHIMKTVAWNARKYAKVLVEGNDARQFALLGCYVEELRSNKSWNYCRHFA